MPDEFFNPYAPPTLPRSRRQVRLSRTTGSILTGLFFVTAIQLATGACTAVVIHAEGTGARSFIAGATLLTLIVTSLVGCAGTMTIRRQRVAMLWGTIVCLVAWPAFISGQAACLWYHGMPMAVSGADLGRFLLLTAISVAAVNLLISRFYLRTQ